MALGALAKIGGTLRYVSKHATKVINGKDATGIYRAANGFAHRLTGFYAGPNATLTEATKTLKDGRVISQKLWSWADGTSIALTSRSDGFLSYVAKNSNGVRTRSVISRNAQHLSDLGTNPGTGKTFANYVNGSKIARLRGGELWNVTNSATSAENLVASTREAAIHTFARHGTPGIHLA